MDALLTALLGCLLGEMGDKSQLLLLALAVRFNHNRAVLLGAAVAAIANAGIAAAAGAVLAPMLGADARLLFAALSVLFLGLGLLWRVKQPDVLENWKIGAFLTTALGLFILGFGDGPQFLILGLTTRTGDPLLAGIGGAIGILAAQIPVILLREQFFKAMPLRTLRLGSAALFLLIGAIMALSALALF
jgi:putative Ca2+/H+ antiporter (TMEM165/GDT1 family)